MLKVRNLTESLEKKYNLDEGGPTLDELSFNDIMDKKELSGNMNWYGDDYPNWGQIKSDLDEKYEYESEEEIDSILNDDSLSDEEKEAAIDDILFKYDQESSDINESLNESFIEEWWGQTEDNPKDLQQYGLKVTQLKRNNDETLYRFSGSLEDINKARNDGYFYSLEIGEDENHSEDLNESLNEAVLNEDYENIYQKVWDAIYDIADADLISNLVQQVSAKVPEYDPDWFNDNDNPNHPYYERYLEKLIDVLSEDLMWKYDNE